MTSSTKPHPKHLATMAGLLSNPYLLLSDQSLLAGPVDRVNFSEHRRIFLRNFLAPSAAAPPPLPAPAASQLYSMYSVNDPLMLEERLKLLSVPAPSACGSGHLLLSSSRHNAAHCLAQSSSNHQALIKQQEIRAASPARIKKQLDDLRQPVKKLTFAEEPPKTVHHRKPTVDKKRKTDPLIALVRKQVRDYQRARQLEEAALAGKPSESPQLIAPNVATEAVAANERPEDSYYYQAFKRRRLEHEIVMQACLAGLAGPTRL